MSWETPDALLLRGGTVVTGAGSARADVLVRLGVIEAVGPMLPVPEGARTEDARGLVLTPGFVDVHVHLRDPGALDSETLESGLEAAAAGGLHHVFCMANTDPVNDAPSLTADLVARARRLSPLSLHPVAAVTRGLRGRDLTDFAALKAAGAGALSNDGLPVEDAKTLRRALERAEDVGLRILVHAEDRGLAADGAVDARAAVRLRAKGIPVEAEDVGTARDVGAAVDAGLPVHVCHVSTTGSVGIVRHARRDGARVTAEATPHHLLLTYEDIPDGDADFKMNPPLRSRADVDAVVAALLDGTITAIATDHAPHAPAKKAVPLDRAPFGAIGLETSFAVSHTALVATGRMPLEALVRLYVDGPAAIAGIEAPAIAPGRKAEINLIDPAAAWEVAPDRFASRSRNCPFKGRGVRGRVVGVVAGRSFRRF
ncbi:MAG TPA: dihydroorotase [Planctomycetota bacterium]|nr:dihydroorotase [Planctomycetota bacterium]